MKPQASLERPGEHASGRGASQGRIRAGTVWGVFGFIFILSQAIYRLAPLAAEPLVDHLLDTWWKWALFVASIVFNGYAEGYKAFHRNAAPRVVARALYLTKNPRPLFIALAPLFCMGLFHATRKRLIVSWSVYAGIIALVIAVRQLSQPWRGMVDAGVVVGLAWGVISLLMYFVRAARGEPMPVSADVPDDAVACEPT